MPPAGFLCALSCRLAFFRRNFQHYRGSNAQSVKSDVFYRASWHPRPGSPDLPTLSRIHARRALWPANGATRPKSTRETTTLSERSLLLFRAGGGVDSRTRKHYRGSEASDRGLVENLRKIPNISFRIWQHYRRNQVPDRVMHVNLREI